MTACQVEKRGDWYVMFYIGFEDEPTARICLARSKDGITNWQRHPANPIIFPGKNKWDHDACYKPYRDLRRQEMAALVQRPPRGSGTDRRRAPRGRRLGVRRAGPGPEQPQVGRPCGRPSQARWQMNATSQATPPVSPRTASRARRLPRGAMPSAPTSVSAHRDGALRPALRGDRGSFVVEHIRRRRICRPRTRYEVVDIARRQIIHQARDPTYVFVEDCSLVSRLQ